MPAAVMENEILMHFRSQRKYQGDVSLSDSIDSDREGNALSLMDVISVEDDMLENLDARDSCAKVRRCVENCLTEREAKVISLQLRFGRRRAAHPARDRVFLWHQSFLCDPALKRKPWENSGRQWRKGNREPARDLYFTGPGPVGAGRSGVQCDFMAFGAGGNHFNRSLNFLGDKVYIGFGVGGQRLVICDSANVRFPSRAMW